MSVLVVFLFFIFNLTSVSGQCTWPGTFASTTWHDATRGDITFATTTMSGWTTSFRSQTFSTWECVDDSSSTLIVMRATNPLVISTLNFNVYACLSLTQVTDNSFYYYELNNQEPNAGWERLRFSQSNTFTKDEICNFSVSIPTQEFHVLVKSGSESSAAIACPSQFLYTADYTYNDTSTHACADSSDAWDVCSDTTEMTFNYTTCSQNIAYSSGGKLWCVASVGSCVVLYNQDATLTATTSRFACMCSDGTSVAVTENNCTSTQTPGVIPTGPDGVSAIGYLLTVGTKSVDCAPVETNEAEPSSSGLGVGAIVGIIIALLLIILIIIVVFFIVRHKKKNGKNKVNESASPILLDKETARVETITETSGSIRKPTRQKSSLSREGSRMDKSMMDGRASVTSIGLEPKTERDRSAHSRMSKKGLEKEKTNVTLISVKPTETQEEVDRGNPVKALLARLPCWPKDSESQKEAEPETPKTPPPVTKTGDAKKGTKKGAVAAKDGKGKGGKKGNKKAAKGEKGGKKGKAEKAEEEMVVTDVENESPQASPKGKPKSPKSPKESPKTPKSTPKTPKDIPEEQKDTAKTKDSGPNFTSTPIPKDKQKSFIADGKVPTFVSTPIPVDPKEKSFATGGKMPTFVSMPSSLHKPEDKKTGWPFLVCCAGTNEPVEEKPEVPVEPEPVITKKPAKGKAAGKAKGKPAKKESTGKKGGKKKAEKSEANGKEAETKKEPGDDKEPEKIDRAKTMPERVREKTTLSIQDAEKVKVDVYIPNEQTQLQLKDTVTVVKDKNGAMPIEKSKSTLGLTRPGSAGSKVSKASTAKPAGKVDKKEKKSKAKGGKEKKGAAKKKKK